MTYAGRARGAANLADMDRVEAEAIYGSGRDACVNVLLVLANQVERLEGRVERLEEEIRELCRGSDNSSLPPSADPKRGRRPGKRKRSDRKPGAQPGHLGSGRGLLPIERVDEVIEHLPCRCRECGGSLAERPARGPVRRHEVAELPEIAVTVTEHRLARRSCPCCGTLTQAQLPPEVPRERFGARLQGAVATLAAGFRLSRRQVAALIGALRLADRRRHCRCDHRALGLGPSRAPEAAWRCGPGLVGGLRR